MANRQNGPDQLAFDNAPIDAPLNKPDQVASDGPSNGPDQIAVQPHRINAADQVAFDGGPIDYPRKERNPTFKVFEIASNSKEYPNPQFDSMARFEQQILKVDMDDHGDAGNPVLDQSDSTTVYEFTKDSSEAKEAKPSWFVQKRKWIIIIALFFILAAILGVTLAVILPKSASDTSGAGPRPSPSTTARPQRTPTSYRVSTVAGSSQGFRDGTASEAQFYFPRTVAVDPRNGDIIVADTSNHCIRRISNGVVSTIAGNSSSGPNFLDGSSSTARFRFPNGVATTQTGIIYVSDFDNFRIRAISPSGMVRTIAGDGTESGPLSINAPTGIATNSNGEVFFSEFGRVRRIALDGTITTFATLRLDRYSSLYFTRNDTLIITEGAQNVIQTISPTGVVSVYTTNVQTPFGVVMDQFDIMYVAEDKGNFISGFMPNGTKFRVAGSGSFSTSDGVGTSAGFQYPNGLVINSQGVIYVVDHGNNRIRSITPQFD